jgi:RNA polymerase sigma-70 factor (ECF subfamily)
MTDHRDDQWLAAAFDEHRQRLRAVAYRVLGSRADAEDAVQEAWLRLSRSDADAIENLGAWLTTVVGRISLDLARSRASRREDPDARPDDGRDLADPSLDAEMADSVGVALMVVLERLSPPERLAFVLHDMFAVPFQDLGPILGRSPGATKQLASRARNKVRGVEPSPAGSGSGLARQRAVVDAFLAASRKGDFDALVALLDPDVVVDADPAATRMGAPQETRGRDAVAAMFSGRALAAEAAVVDGHVGLTWNVGDRPRVVWNLYIDDETGTIVHIDMHADQQRIDILDVTPL